MQHEKDPLPHSTLSEHCEPDKLCLSDGAGVDTQPTVLKL